MACQQLPRGEEQTVLLAHQAYVPSSRPETSTNGGQVWAGGGARVSFGLSATAITTPTTPRTHRSMPVGVGGEVRSWWGSETWGGVGVSVPEIPS